MMVDQNTFLMSIDGVKDLFLSIFFDVSVEGSAFTAAATILYPYLLINDAFVFEFVK